MLVKGGPAHKTVGCNWPSMPKLTQTWRDQENVYLVPMLTYRPRCSLAFTWEHFHQKCLLMCREIALLKLFPRLPSTLSYNQTSNISRTSVDNIIVDHSNIVGASPVGAAPTASSFSTWHFASMNWAKTTTGRDEKHLSLGIWCYLY